MVPGELRPGSADHLMVVLLPPGTDRHALRTTLSQSGIATSVHFQPLHRFEWFRNHAVVGPIGIAVAERLADRALSLPLHPAMTDAQVDRVVDGLAEALRGGGARP